MNKREMTVNEWLNNEELPITIWKNKYQQDNETFEQWLDRGSGSNEDVKELIRKKKFIFGGRILSNRGIKGRSLTYITVMLLPLQKTISNLSLQPVPNLQEHLVMAGDAALMLASYAPKEHQ